MRNVGDGSPVPFSFCAQSQIVTAGPIQESPVSRITTSSNRARRGGFHIRPPILPRCVTDTTNGSLAPFDTGRTVWYNMPVTILTQRRGHHDHLIPGHSLLQ